MQKANAQTSNIITGYVYSSDDHMPVADANVMFENTDISTTTDSVGPPYVCQETQGDNCKNARLRR